MIFISASVETRGIIISGTIDFVYFSLILIVLQKLLYIAFHKFLGKIFLVCTLCVQALDFVRVILLSILYICNIFLSIPSNFETSIISFSDFGKNSCNGGSSNLTVTGKPCIILNISIKSFF